MSTPPVADPIERPTRTPVPRWVLAAVAVAAVVAASVGGYQLLRPDTVPAASSMTLTLPGDDSMMSCLAFSVEVLAPMPVAFAGTAVQVTPDTVVLDVEKWYRGGDAQQVSLTPAPGEHVALIGSIRFEVGKRYLVTATDGMVNSCGFTQEWTPEGAAAFEQAFAN